jgi:phospho-2-dehydro-3-deoxyheptonate aldolase
MFCIVGPCSIHNVKSAIEYGILLAELAHGLRGELLIVMRVYFEKPRTTSAWKGLMNDPNLDGSYVYSALFTFQKFSCAAEQNAVLLVAIPINKNLPKTCIKFTFKC